MHSYYEEKNRSLSSTGVIFAPAAKMRLLLGRKIFCNQSKNSFREAIGGAAKAWSFFVTIIKNKKVLRRAHRRFRLAGAETAGACRNEFLPCKKTKLFRPPKAALKRMVFLFATEFLIINF